ncbi:MAG TPA: sigma-70 family RNA polymerase sigma factor [Polyangiales bacterium]|nr:sigma-70 family RNA polymerase sigma factor [Polyangiales bacterium]
MRHDAPATSDGQPTAPAVAAPSIANSCPPFADVYEQNFEFVWRSARRLGVPESSLDDVVQDVFVTVYRRLPDFEGRSQVKTWVFGILRNTVNDLRRSQRRKPTEALTAEPIDLGNDSPQDAFAREQGARLLHAVLTELEDDLREVFVLSELEQMSAPEVASALSVNVNTVYSRLRAARRDFDAALKRLRTRDEWRMR